MSRVDSKVKQKKKLNRFASNYKPLKEGHDLRLKWTILFFERSVAFTKVVSTNKKKKKTNKELGKFDKHPSSQAFNGE